MRPLSLSDAMNLLDADSFMPALFVKMFDGKIALLKRQATASGTSGDLLLMVDSNVIRELQRRLAARGYYAGELDGWCGPATYEALQRWLVDSGYDVGPWGCNGYGGPDTNTAVGKAILAGAFRTL